MSIPKENGRGRLLMIRQDNYEQGAVDRAVQRAFDAFGGAGKFMRRGDKVVLKVNLVAGYSPERRVTTDPAVVRAAARAVLDCGARPVIADSPGIDRFASAAEKAGFIDIARELGIECAELTDPVPLEPAEGAVFRRIEAARLITEADAVINLPKVKTHGQMTLTLGVKNMFGCVVGRSKAAWHYDVGFDRELFASLLIDIYRAVRPCFTIFDGVIGMDGHGPTSGDPCPYGFIAAAEDALAADMALCGIMGCRMEDFPLYRAAAARGLLGEPALIEGDEPPTLTGVRIPRSRFGLRFMPKIQFLERLLSSRPVHVPELCTGCGRCASVCAAGALKISGRSAKFDYGRCIRCYCCHEMCPENAIKFRESPLARWL